MIRQLGVTRCFLRSVTEVWLPLKVQCLTKEIRYDGNQKVLSTEQHSSWRFYEIANKDQMNTHTTANHLEQQSVIGKNNVMAAIF